MTTILKPGVEKVMRVFYSELWKDIHLRELGRRTNLEGQSITRHLDILEKTKYLTSRKDGNQKKYSLRHNKKVFALISLFDIDKFERLPEIRKQAIETYLNTLPQQPIFAVLFGSTAKENYTSESDIDVLLVTNRKIDASSAGLEAEALQTQNISTFQVTYKVFTRELKLKEDPVVQSAFHSGYPLINHIRYYEALSNGMV